jgi:Transglutaminase-like superfamily/MMPL family
VFLKEVGLGTAAGVLIDAFIVRTLLVPSLMGLLGRWNWWAPRLLRRVVPPPPPPHEPRERTGGPGRSPRDPWPAGVADTLAATPFCDHDHPSIRAAVREIAGRAAGADEVAIATASFRFVRDEVRYAFGPWGLHASGTLAERRGTCTNKANLLVALLRAAAIPAAYGVMRVNAREYFGVLGPRFLTRLASAESVHVYAAALLDGRWVKCDASTDRELAELTSHFSKQTRLIEWDGRHDSLDFLDARHVYADLGLYANIDELLQRPARAGTPRLLAMGNLYLDFIRSHPAYDSSSELIDAYRASSSNGHRERPPRPARRGAVGSGRAG